MLEVRPDFPQGFGGTFCKKKANNLKITNVALVAMSQGLPPVTKGYQRSQMSNSFGLAQLIF